MSSIFTLQVIEGGVVGNFVYLIYFVLGLLGFYAVHSWNKNHPDS